MIKLIKNIQIYAPDDLGVQDVLVIGDKIAKVAPNIEPFDYGEIIDGKDLILSPGLIDQHVHLTGGGGEGGFTTRVPEIELSELTTCGITTVVGLLGTDVYTRSIENLLSKTKALNEEGMTAYCLTGGYRYPSVTLTDSVEKDLIFINEIIGLKLAISDHRSSFVTSEELKRLATQVRVASMVSNKQGYIHLHMGRDPLGLKDVFKILEETSLPIKLFKPTHVHKILDDAIQFAKLGGIIDFTASKNAASINSIIRAIKETPQDHVTLSSDANGSLPRWNDKKELIGMGVGSPTVLIESLKRLIESNELSIESVFSLVTKNVAQSIGLYPKKGIIHENSDADLIIWDPSMKIMNVMAKGQWLIRNQKIIKKGTFKRS